MNKDILAQKEAVVRDLSQRMKDAGSVVVVEYRGLNVADISELRRALRKEEAEMQVYKNSLAQRAAQELGYEALIDALTGPNALVFGVDQVTPARILADFAKGHNLLVLKSGIVDGAVVDEETIKTLSKLPNKEGMLARFASTLNAPLIKLALTIKALAESKENGGAAPAESTEEVAGTA